MRKRGWAFHGCVRWLALPGLLLLSILFGACSGYIDGLPNPTPTPPVTPPKISGLAKVAGTRATITWTEPAGITRYEIGWFVGTPDISIPEGKEVVNPAASYSQCTLFTNPPAPCGSAGCTNSDRMLDMPLNTNIVACVKCFAGSTECDPVFLGVSTATRTITYTGETADELLGRQLSVGFVNDDTYPDILVGAAKDTDVAEQIVLPLFLGRTNPDPNGNGTWLPQVKVSFDNASRAFGWAVTLGDVLGCDGRDDLVIADHRRPVTIGGPTDGIIYAYNAPNVSAESSTTTSLTSADVVSTLESDSTANVQAYYDIDAGEYGGACDTLFVVSPKWNNGILFSDGIAYEVAPPIAAGTRQFQGAENFDDSIFNPALGITWDSVKFIGNFCGNGGQPDVAYISDESGTNVTVGLAGGDVPANSGLWFPYGGVDLGTTISPLGDLNGDGFDDIAVTIIGTFPGLVSQVMIFYGNATCPSIFAFPAPDLEYDFAGVHLTGPAIAVGDYDNDGHKDLIIGSDGTNVYYYKGPNFVSGSAPSGTISGFQASSALIVDFNQDGYEDLILGGGVAGNNRVQISY